MTELRAKTQAFSSSLPLPPFFSGGRGGWEWRRGGGSSNHFHFSGVFPHLSTFWSFWEEFVFQSITGSAASTTAAKGGDGSGEEEGAALITSTFLEFFHICPLSGVFGKSSFFSPSPVLPQAQPLRDRRQIPLCNCVKLALRRITVYVFFSGGQSQVYSFKCM